MQKRGKMNREREVLDIAKKYGVIKASDVESVGISRNYLYKLCKEGLLNKLGRGVYMSIDTPITEHINLVEISKRVPNAVTCLISSLNFHHITTQIPHKIWIALPKGTWSPKIEYPPLEIMYVSESAYFFGIEEHQINGSIVKVYTLAKTIADCFKFRNKVGLDVAIEALREAWREKKININELMEAAKVNRVANVMRPYIEAII